MTATQNRFATLTAIALAISLTACSKADDKANTTTATQPASTASPASATPVASAPVVASVASSAPTVIASSTTTTVTTETASAPTVVAPAVLPTNSATTAPAKAEGNVALKADLTTLFKTLNQMDKDTIAQQEKMAKKMQNAKTPADQASFFKDVVAQLDNQKATLTKLKFNDPRVAQARDKMVESINNSRTGTSALIKKPTATPENSPEIAKSMEKAQKSAMEAREMLMKLTEEAGIKPNAQAPQGQTKK
ncbi:MULTISPECIES: hypothetical protein [unclassified Moraxella]|uniref:hypothetical protein n=1 Tax=unclassified Moraxella TaxID=2685852 RepID=UPI003AF7AEB1